MSYYGDKVYNSQAIPPQTKPLARGWLKQFAQIHLPWGYTEPVVPNLFFQEHSPDYMRRNDYDEKLRQQMEQGIKAGTYSLDQTGNAIDQQAIRYAPLATRTHIIGYAYGGSKFLTFFFGVMIFLTIILGYIKLEDMDDIKEFTLGCIYMWLPFPTVWLVCYLIMRFLPSLWFGVGAKGMQWELNRRTGMVTVRKDGFSAPFYEWDAYLHSFPGQSGVIFYKLYLIHRYQEYTVDLTYFSAATNTKWDAYAAWDFIQNYMDTSQPIPDIPLLERWRPYDPVTAEYDQQTNRSPSYWFDMDDATWQTKEQHMQNQVIKLDPMRRPNLMVKYYSDLTA